MAEAGAAAGQRCFVNESDTRIDLKLLVQGAGGAGTRGGLSVLTSVSPLLADGK
jgi:hypothetical protein